MTFDVPAFVHMLERRGARFAWFDLTEFFLDLDDVQIDEAEEIAIRYKMCDVYTEVVAHLLSRETKH
jgi:hypothetical protein